MISVSLVTNYIGKIEQQDQFDTNYHNLPPVSTITLITVPGKLIFAWSSYNINKT